MQLEQIIDRCKELCAKVGVELNVPVEINSRLTRTLGRVKYRVSGNIAVPYLIEFSKQFVTHLDDETIESVIAHEVAHYCVTKITGQRHGHDEVFKIMCAKLGTSNNGVSTKVEASESYYNEYKYIVKCPNCGILEGKTRMTKNLRNIQYCSCAKCGSNNLVVQQNY